MGLSSRTVRRRGGVSGATRDVRAARSLVAPLRRLNRLERQGLDVSSRRHALACVLPDRDVAETLVVPPRFAIRRLELLAEVPAAGLAPLQRVPAHELAQLEVVGHTPRLLQLLVEVAAFAGNPHVGPDPVAKRGDARDGRLET